MTGELHLVLVDREQKLARILESIGGQPAHVFHLGRCVRCHHHVWDDQVCTAFDPWKWLGDALALMREARRRGYSIRFEAYAGTDDWICFVTRDNTNDAVVRHEDPAVAITEALCEAMGWKEKEENAIRERSVC